MYNTNRVESTVPVTVRMTSAMHDDMLLECDDRGINPSDWIRIQFARSKRCKENRDRLIYLLGEVKSFRVCSYRKELKELLDEIDEVLENS